ncbi:hypothetical protein KAW44_04215, partial [Candidatus Bipolaricaulota bacterium]|nr:hypothetical protein [Candidatus Bipolaricaulota bacterium]
MRLRINQIIVKLKYTPEDVLHVIARRLEVQEQDLGNVEILRRSIDARKKDRPPLYVLSVEVSYEGETPPALTPGQVDVTQEPEPRPVVRATRPITHRPIVVGAGPAGLMTALMLA